MWLNVTSQGKDTPPLHPQGRKLTHVSNPQERKCGPLNENWPFKNENWSPVNEGCPPRIKLGSPMGEM